MDYDIDFNKKSHRKANIFAISIGIIGFILYVNQYVQTSNIRGFEYLIPFLYGTLCYLLGLVSGLIFFDSKNPLGIILPFISLLVHVNLFGDERGDDFDEFLLVAWYLILSTGIVLAVSFLIGMAYEYIKAGK